jgi:hypothetical protein
MRGFRLGSFEQDDPAFLLTFINPINMSDFWKCSETSQFEGAHKNPVIMVICSRRKYRAGGKASRSGSKVGYTDATCIQKMKTQLGSEQEDCVLSSDIHFLE